MDSSLFDRYLKLLGVEAGPPSFGQLNRLVRAQLMRVPFENLSKLLLKRRGAHTVPTLEEYLDGIEEFGFGGTCYANNPYFNQLLQHLGYEADLCGAAMSKPDVHIVSIVHLEGREYLVDVGYAAPFFDPIPRDLGHTQEILWGHQRYVLHPQDAERRSQLDHYHEERLIHGYTINPVARSLDHFDEVISDSYRDSATFMNALAIERFYAEGSVRIHNLTRSESSPEGSSSRQLRNRKELIETVKQDTGIPLDLVHEALDGLKLEGDIFS